MDNHLCLQGEPALFALRERSPNQRERAVQAFLVLVHVIEL